MSRGHGPPRLFGIVDAARDPRLYPMIAALPERSCLLAGTVPPDLAHAAPYLVALPPESTFLKVWQEIGWGESWGIFCLSHETLPSLRRHLRQFLKARLPDGHVVFFRFYDPRVWRTYIGTCEGTDLHRWFSHAAGFYAETQDGRGTVLYEEKAGQLSSVEV